MYKESCTDIVTVVTISFLYLTYVTLQDSRPLSKLMLYRTTSLLYVACDDIDRNRYSVLSTSPYRSNISLPSHHSKFQTYGSELERSLLCSYEVWISSVQFADKHHLWVYVKLPSITKPQHLIFSTYLLTILLTQIPSYGVTVYPICLDGPTGGLEL